MSNLINFCEKNYFFPFFSIIFVGYFSINITKFKISYTGNVTNTQTQAFRLNCDWKGSNINIASHHILDFAKAISLTNIKSTT